jgi:hypothetical protein
VCWFRHFKTGRGVVVQETEVGFCVEKQMESSEMIYMSAVETTRSRAPSVCRVPAVDDESECER